jgi:rhamnosyltransferase
MNQAVSETDVAERAPRGRARVQISIVIPVKNGGEGLRTCLRAISTQRTDDFEIIVVDSGSTDDTPELARSFGARVCHIPPHEFNHGATRNLGAQLAQGEILVFTVDDAVPLRDDWLERLTAPLRNGSGIVATYSRQIPRADAVPPERYFLGFLYGLEPRIQQARGQSDLSMDATLFSNCGSAMTRSIWERFQFTDDIIVSEDQEWSSRVLASGYAIAYVPEAEIRHSHKYTIVTAFKHFFDSGVSAERAYLAGGKRSARVLRHNSLRYGIGQLTWLWRTRQRRWIPYSMAYDIAKFAGLQVGRRYRLLPVWLRRRCSHLPIYWSAASAEARARRRVKTTNIG